MAAITLTDIVKRYGDGFLAVKGVSLDIADGEFVILVGPSGCGKSTLLRMIVGLEDITSGELRIGDQVVNDKAPRDRRLAMVFQNYALYPHLTVFENIAFPLRLTKGQFSEDEIRTKVEHAARTLELTDHLERKPANLSGGQRQRVAMGRAIVRDANAFLFDEPLSNLDAKLRGQMRTEIARMQRRLGTTTVYVTHDQTEAMTMGERICVLKAGVIQQVDTPTALYDRPANAFVASFIGSPEMNIVPAQLRGCAVELGGLRLPLPAGRFKPAADGALQFGLRPEHIGLGAKPGSVAVEATLKFCEHMGAEVFTYFDVGGVAFSARIPAEEGTALTALQRGAPLGLHFQMGHAHLFTADEDGPSLLA